MSIDNIKRYLSEMTALKQWVCFQLGAKNSKGKQTKVPKYINASGILSNAASNAPNTWMSFQDAASITTTSGVGFVFTKNDPFVGIDLDNCRNELTGRIEPWAAEIIDQFDSYTEITPGKKGFHIICKGNINHAFKTDPKSPIQIEIYDTLRFFTMTGDLLNTNLIEVRDNCTEKIKAIIEKYGKQRTVKPETNGHAKVSFDANKISLAARYMQRLSLERCNHFDGWLSVGMALHELGEVGLAMWIEWSRLGTTFKQGECQDRWKTFGTRTSDQERITFGSLSYYAAEDDPEQVETFSVDLSDEISHEILELLLEDKKFRQTWELKRSDLADNTQKTYDRSLARLGVINSLSSQQIATLIISHRRKHQRSLDDLLKDDYLFKLIKWARDASKEKKDANNNVIESNSKEESLNSLNQQFGIKITKLIKQVSEPPQYVLMIDDKKVKLGEIGSILDQKTFRSKVASSINKLIPFIKKNWETYAQLLLNIIEDEDIGDDTTDVGKAVSWVTGHLHKVNLDSEDPDRVDPETPFMRDGSIYIITKSLKQYIAAHGEKVTAIYFGQCMRAMGAVAVRIVRRTDGKSDKWRTIYGWRIPPNIIEAHFDKLPIESEDMENAYKH